MEHDNFSWGEVFSSAKILIRSISGMLCVGVGVAMLLICPYLDSILENFEFKDVSIIKGYGHIWVAAGTFLAVIAPILSTIEAIKGLREKLNDTRDLHERIKRLENIVERNNEKKIGHCD